MIQCQCLNTYEDDIYILTSEEHDLLVYHSSEDYIEYIGCIRKDEELYICSCMINKKIYYFSLYNRQACCYDIETNYIDYFEISINDNSNISGNVRACFVYNNEIIIVRATDNCQLVAYNPDAQKTRLICSWEEAFSKKYNHNARSAVYNNLCVLNGELWMPLNEKNLIVKINLDTEKYDFYELPTDGVFFHTLNKDNFGNFWITGDSPVVIKWNPCTNIIEHYNKFPNGFTYRKGLTGWDDSLFYCGYLCDDTIIYAPLDANMFICIDTRNGQMKRIPIDMNLTHCFHFYCLDNNSIYLETTLVNQMRSKSAYRIFKSGIFKHYEFNSNTILYKGITKSHEFMNRYLFTKEGDGIRNLKWFLNILG